VKRLNIVIYLFVLSVLISNTTLNAQPISIDDYIEKCKTSLENNEPILAIEFGEKAIALDESNPEVHYLLGEAYISSLQQISKLKMISQVKKAKKEWERAAELDKNQIGARESLINFHLYAPGLMGGDKDEAKILAEEIFNSDSLKGRLSFGLIHSRNEEYAKAENEYKKVIAADSEMWEGYSYLGDLYFMKKDFNDSHKMYLKVLDIKPDNSDTYYNLGNCVLKSGQNLESGITYFETFLVNSANTFDGLRAHVHCQIAEIYKKMSDAENAKKEYKKALEIDPSNKVAKKAIKQL